MAAFSTCGRAGLNNELGSTRECKLMMEGTSKSTNLLNFTTFLTFEIVLLVLGGLFIIIALLGGISSIWGSFGPISKPTRFISGVLGVVLILIAVLLTAKPLPPVESCHYIAPSIVKPVSDEAISFPTTVQGVVKKVPMKSSLWLMVYDHKKAIYISASQLAVDDRKRWQKEVDCSGCMVGTRCTLEVILADTTAHSQLSQFTPIPHLPSATTPCSSVTVIVAQ
jgi:hypothetical protein